MDEKEENTDATSRQFLLRIDENFFPENSVIQ